MKTVAILAILAGLSVASRAQDEYDVPWSSVNSGGTIEAQSENYLLMGSVGQPGIGVSTAADYSVGAGFWYAVWTVCAPQGYFGSPWAWCAIPIHPMNPTPDVLFGFNCKGVLWRFDKYIKAPIVYMPPFVKFNLSVGDSYLFYSAGYVPDPPCYSGFVPPEPYEFKLGKQGWTWVGMPGLRELGYPDFMPNVIVKYPSDDSGVERTAEYDRAQSPNNWVNWGWSFWDTAVQCPKTLTPYLPFGNNVCHPWLGYRTWVLKGGATYEDDPDQVTLIWPAW
jgi:hypothetical protein